MRKVARVHQPTSPDTLHDLRALRERAAARGDHTMAVLLHGLELYAGLGREYELLEIMKQFAEEMQPIVENTPSAEQLKALYERPDGAA
jgi:hypothetical protein